jgi:hypothetical protein
MEKAEKKNMYALPDWCKVGEWVYSRFGGYDEIIAIQDFRIATHRQKYSAEYINEGNVVHAYLRPFNSWELKNLVGKILVNKKTRNMNLVTDYIYEVGKIDPLCHTATVCVGGAILTAEDLLENFTMEGYPCGHLSISEME